MEGVGSLISIVTVTFTAPPLLFAQIVYTVEVEFTLGVPETSPVNGSSSSPAGNAGSTCHVATCPPVFAIVIPSNATSRVPTRLVGVAVNSPVVH